MEHTQQKSGLELFCQNAEALLALESEMTRKPLDADLLQRLSQWKSGIIRVVVMGEIKSGKSSFINALLGRPNLVPVNSDVATSTIFRIGYGEKIGYTVFFQSECGKAPLEIDVDQLDAFGTENGNPNNEKQVDFIKVTCPSLLLKSGMEIVDTSGLGGLFRKHKYITYQFVPQADAVFLVTDGSNAPLGKAELELLGDLRKVTHNVFFIQSKSGAIDSETRQSRIRNNREILCRDAKFREEEIKLFAVDSKRKAKADETHNARDLEKSGFSEIMAFVEQTLRPNIQGIIVGRAIPELQPHLAAVASMLDSQEKLLSADTSEKIKELEEENRKIVSDIDQFEHGGLLDNLQDFIDDGFSNITKGVSEFLKTYQSTGDYALTLRSRIDGQTDVTGVRNESEAIRTELAEKVSEDTFACLADIEEKCEKLLNEASSKVENLVFDGNFPTGWAIAPDVILAPSVNPKDPTMYEKGRAMLYGKFAGAGVGGFVGGIIGGIAGSVIPGPGTVAGAQAGAAVGSAIGGFFGARQGYTATRNQSLQQAKQIVKNDVSLWLAKCQATIGDPVNAALQDSNRKVKRALRDGIRHYRAALKQRMDEIKKRERASAASITQGRQTLNARKQRLAAIQQAILASSK